MSFLLNPFRLYVPAGSTIGFRGSVTGISTSSTISLDLTALTGGDGSAALDGDIVYVAGGRASSGINDDVSMSTAGYTELADLYADDGNDCNLGVFRKVMVGTPDTTAVITVNGTSTGGAAATAFVFYAIDTTTPEDVTRTTATGANTNVANPPSITPITPGAWILAFYAGTSGTTVTGPTAPANMTNFRDNTSGGSTRRYQIGGALKTDWSSGAFDPDPWAGTTDDANQSWAAVTIPLRPA